MKVNLERSFSRVDECFNFTMRQEGGLSNDKYDAGGLTNFGVASNFWPPDQLERVTGKRSVTELTLEDAKKIYVQAYCSPIQFMSLPWPVALYMAEAAYSMGVGAAGVMLQRACYIGASGPAIDGAVGPLTIAALSRKLAADGALAVGENIATQMRRYRFLDVKRTPERGVFLAGWTQRIVEMVSFGYRMHVKEILS